MAWLGLRLYTDEDERAGPASALRARGYDVLACHEAGYANQGTSDARQLAIAQDLGRVILTHTIVDFVRLDHAWKAQGRRHAGILVTPNGIAIGEMLRRVQRHLDTVAAEQQADVVLFPPG